MAIREVIRTLADRASQQFVRRNPIIVTPFAALHSWYVGRSRPLIAFLLRLAGTAFASFFLAMIFDDGGEHDKFRVAGRHSQHRTYSGRRPGLHRTTADVDLGRG
jgi:hypothetical protein